MSVLRFRLLGSRADADDVIARVHGIENIEHVEELDALEPVTRDDSSSSESVADGAGHAYVKWKRPATKPPLRCALSPKPVLPHATPASSTSANFDRPGSSVSCPGVTRQPYPSTMTLRRTRTRLEARIGASHGTGRPASLRTPRPAHDIMTPLSRPRRGEQGPCVSHKPASCRTSPYNR